MSDEFTNSDVAEVETPAFLRDAEFIELEGKRPVRSSWTTDPSVRLTSEEAQQRLSEGRNVGVVLGPRDLVLDVDPRNGGDESLKRLKADLSLDLSAYPTVRTGSGGLHIYMRLPHRAGRLKGDLGRDGYPGVELKFVGRQVVAPGSVHPETRGRYEVVQDLDPLDEDLGVPEAPKALLELAARPQASSKQTPPGAKSPEWLADALEHLDVSAYRGDHAKWLELMMACHDATGGAGCDEFVAWSTSDPIYSGQGETIARRWDSLDSKKAGRVTARTLEKHLVDAGVAHLVQPDFEEAADDFAAFDELPDYLAQGDDHEGNSVDRIIRRMNERFCAVLEGGGYSIYMKDVDDLYDPPRPVLTRLSREAFRHYHENERVTLPDKKAPVSVADLWLKDERMRKYPGIVLDPSGREKSKLNLWRGWAVDPAPGDWSLMRELIEEVLCAGNAEHADYVLRWIAFMVQKPAVQPQTAIAFRGNEGTGKGTLGRALMQLAGRHGITVSSAKQLAGNFNAHLRNAVFVFADEAFWPGNKEAEGTLKQLVTEPVISFEPKGKDVMLGRNHVHLMLASNEEWIVPAGKDARRFAVFDVTEARRNDFAFFGRLKQQMDEGGLAAMLHDLQAIDLGDWHPARSVPQTEALADQKLLSLDPASKFWMEVLQRGSIGTIREEEWSSGPLTLASERQELVEDYDAFLKRNRIFSAKATSKALVNAGKALGLEPGRTAGNTTRAWTLPPLDEARRLFEKRVGTSGLFG